jgi:hypothetical protein
VKYLQLFESYDDVQEHLEDIFTDLIDEGYDVEVFRGYDDSDNIEYRVTIKSSGIFFFDSLISNTLKKSISIMDELGYRYGANFHRADVIPFYIYLDSRGLRTSGLKMDENWPSTTRINLDFYI